ncbi:MAG TPA: GNAT family N-acetyltransferase [Stellaceae bacterium]|nr:GNAT family N-acetyltransferase [Stellaceae bacterium]
MQATSTEQRRSEPTVRVRAVSAEEAADRAADLADILLDCVAGGASVSFMAPLSRDKAVAFWQQVADDVSRGERVLMVAEDEASGLLVGTAQLVLGLPENQPHRADVSKVLVRRQARNRGIGAALMTAIEDAARAAGKTLLVLDTASAEAERLYQRSGWVHVGVIPGYALLPDGTPCDTAYYYKRLD